MFGKSYGKKLNARTPSILAGSPLRVIGLKRAEHAAFIPGMAKSGWPESVPAAIGLPDSSIKTCTLMPPRAPTALAASGYSGFSSEVAFELAIPMLTVFRSEAESGVFSGRRL